MEGILTYIGLKDIFILSQPNCKIQRYDNTGTDKSLYHFYPTLQYLPCRAITTHKRDAGTCKVYFKLNHPFGHYFCRGGVFANDVNCISHHAVKTVEMGNRCHAFVRIIKTSNQHFICCITIFEVCGLN